MSGRILKFPSISPLSALYYVKVMKKVLEKGVEYVKTEHERLGRILSELYLSVMLALLFLVQVVM